MTKLNQIIAIEKGIKSRVYGIITDLHKSIQKPDLFNGFSKEYHPRDDADEVLPPERKRVQFTVAEVLRALTRSMSELFDVTARKDWTNCVASADITIDGEPVVKSVPVPYLLFLEKQLTDIRTFVNTLPVLDESDAWSKDENSGLFRTEVTQTHRTKKIAKAIVLYPATPEHPAQTQMVSEDIIAGFWHQMKQSGAMQKPQKDALTERVEKLLQAVKQAREAANNQEEVSPPSVAAAIFNYLGL